MNEDWGIVPLESMTNSKAVIANASGGPLESIADGETGFLTPVNDIDAWAVNINKLALTDGLYEQMGKNAHTHVKKFTWETFVSNVDNALDEWVQQKSSLKLEGASDT